MTDQPEEAIRPVAVPDHLDTKIVLVSKDFYSRCVFWLAVFAGLAAIGMSLIAFAGFAENDQNVTHLMSAFALCFGIGSLVFGPMALIAFYARKAIHQPLPRGRAVIVLLLMLPWFFLGYFVWKIGGSWRIVSIAGVLIALFMSVWALRSLKPR